MTLAQRYEWSDTPLKARAEPCRGAFSGFAHAADPFRKQVKMVKKVSKTCKKIQN